MHGTEKTHFSLFSVTPASRSFCKTLRRRLPCSSWSTPKTSISSIMHTTPSVPSRIRDILFWKCSGADEIPNGKRWKQYLPKGVMNVVNSDDSCDRGTCQKPEFASNFVNTSAFRSCASVSSTAGSMCLSRLIDAFSFVRSTQIRTFPLGFGTTTIGTHQSVGVSTFEITWSDSIVDNSSLTFGRSGNAIRRGVLTANGLAPSFRHIRYSSRSVPNPLKISGY